MKHLKITDYKDNIENFDKVNRITDFENFFNVYLNKKDENPIFNLNASMYLNANKDFLPSMKLQHAAFWPLLSYQIYNTPRLAWLLMKLNDVKAKDMFDIVPTGSLVYYLDQQTMQNIVASLN